MKPSDQDFKQIDSTGYHGVGEPCQTGKYVAEENLVFVQSDSLRIFTIEDGKAKFQLRCDFGVSD